MHREALEKTRDLPDEPLSQISAAQISLGQDLLEQQKFAEAEPLLLAGYNGIKAGETESLVADNVKLKNALGYLVTLYLGLGQEEKATEWREKLKDLNANDLDPATMLPAPKE